MDIVVCIKQAPDTAEIKIDPMKNTLIRTGVPSVMNPFDKNALETDLQSKDRYDGKVTVIFIGPPQAKAVLRKTLAMGADKAYLVTNRAFGGSDTYTTSHILSRAIKELGGFDIILGDRQAIDEDTGQTTPDITEHLGVVKLTYTLNMEIEGSKVIARRRVGEGVEIIEISLPVLCTATKESNGPRYATIEGVLNSLKAEIGKITLVSLSDSDATKMGLKGSPTKVKTTFTLERSANYMNIEGNSPAETAGALVNRSTRAKAL